MYVIVTSHRGAVSLRSLLILRPLGTRVPGMCTTSSAGFA